MWVQGRERGLFEERKEQGVVVIGKEKERTVVGVRWFAGDALLKGGCGREDDGGKWMEVEKQRLFQVFLKQFVDVHSKWEPIISGEWTDTTSSTISHEQIISQSGNLVVGCFAGHPTELLVALLDEITQLTSVVTEVDSRGVKSSYPVTVSTSLRVSSVGLPVLEALLIVVRSLHNCRVLGYYGVVQKLIALIKAAVVQLKAIAGAISGDDGLSDLSVDTFELLQKLLVHAVSIICSFIDLSSNAHEMAHFYDTHTVSLASGGIPSREPFNIFKVHHVKRHPWKQTAIISVMEAGGLN
ncbi:hypothetical protein KSS87_000679 [Heliosperma pusillum]|nr:hypothetical protein KSS87_000679 [Heliosperma pusillum]